MGRKYELVKEDSIEFDDVTLYRIRALKDFGNVKAGDLGGYIEKEENLSHNGLCWVYDIAKVLDSAKVSDDARVFDIATVSEHATVCDKATVLNCAKIYGFANIKNYTTVECHARVFGMVNVLDNALITGHSKICGCAIVRGYSMISGSAVVCENADIYGYTCIDNNGYIRRNSEYVTICNIGPGSQSHYTFYLTKDGHIMVHSSEFNMSMNKFISFVDNYYIFDDVDRERLRKTIEYVKAILK